MVKKKEDVKPLVPKSIPEESITKDGAGLVANFITKDVTNNVTKDVTNYVTKNVTFSKSIIIGKKKITAKFSSDKKIRPNYSLCEETVEKINEISELLGYKKTEFLDIYLNGTLTKLLKKLKE